MGFESKSHPFRLKEVKEVHTQKVLEYINSPRNLEYMRNYDGKGEKPAKVGKQIVTLWIFLKNQR